VDLDTADLSEWLRETYYDEDKKAFFAEGELEEIGDLIVSMLKFRAQERPTAAEVLEHPLMKEGRFERR
jgi:serine/threonine protein kinase